MDNGLMYVVIAFAITGLVIGGYLLTLAKQARNVEEEFEVLSGESPRRQPEPTITSKPRPASPGKTRA
ncbi:CcmD family protein [Nitrolancea hollandica]|uniref:CcmD family protein n=1 Tax=Nitrolancea hollandica Lb TaxID=1129897 RepID=I4EDD0_9BACT|nr:CcmD family protein [Nitrolancea hollandica]CCF82692.1 conserved hypothetical protein [Nitrolancea hollandica Lb]